MVVLGAILIWFGLSRNDGGVPTVRAGDGAQGASDGAIAADGASAAGLSFTSGAVQAAPAVHDSQARWGGDGAAGGRAGVDEEVLAAGAGNSGYDASLDPGPAAGGQQFEPSTYDPDTATYEQDPDVSSEAYEPAPAGYELEAPALSFGARSRKAAGVYQLGGAAPPAQGLAVMLLDAWLRADPQDLETYLKVGEGADLPASQGQLVAAFWEALAGELDAARQRLESLRGAESITSTQLALLQAALDEPGARAVPSSAPKARIEPLAHAMKMVLLSDEARTLLQAREYGRSAMAWSDLIQAEVAAPWRPNREALLGWAKELKRAQSNHRFSPRGAWPYVEEKVGPGDSLTVLRKRVLRRRPDLLLCTGLIAEVNGIRGYLQPGDVLRIPTEHANVIVDLDARLVMYRHGDEVVQAWECGIGKPGHETPIGVYTIGIKQERPAHTTKGLPYGHPLNPLGSRWLALEKDGRNTSYGIHGTSDPDGVGEELSLGCIRMRNEEVNELFEILPVGATVVLQE